MIIVPSLLVLLGYGFAMMDNKKNLKTIFLSLFFVINLFYLVFMNTSAFKIQREGFRPLAEIINNSDIKQNDIVIVWNRKEVLDKYITKKLNVFSLLQNFAYTSETLLGNESKLNKYSTEEKKDFLRTYFIDENIPKNTSFIMDSIHNALKPEQKFVITTNKKTDEFTQKSFIKLVKDDNRYGEMSYNDLLTIKALIDLKSLCNEKLHFIKRVQNKDFVVYIYEK